MAGVRQGLTVALAGVRGLTVLWPASLTVSGHCSSRCAAGPHCALACVPHGEWCWASFRVSVCHRCVFFGEMSVQTFHSFWDWAVCVFDIELHELLVCLGYLIPCHLLHLQVFSPILRVTSLVQPREAPSLGSQGWSLPVVAQVVMWVGWHGLNPRASPPQQMPSSLPNRGLLDGRMRPAAFPLCPWAASRAPLQHRTGFQIKALCSIAGFLNCVC